VLEISADTDQVRDAGDDLRAASRGLEAVGGLADSISSTSSGMPFTDAALGTLARDWSRSLRASADTLAALGSYANLVAEAFEHAAG
jgi:hypothetical protein